MNEEKKSRPARPLRTKVKVEPWGDSLRLRYRHREWSIGCFLILWLVGWTVGCVFLAGMAIRDPKMEHLLFGVPFWASWFFVFALVLKKFFQREELTLGPGGVTFAQRVFVGMKHRELPLDEVKGFSIFERSIDGETKTMEYGLKMETLGLPLEFATGLDHSELRWLQGLLQQYLNDLRKRLRLEPLTPELPVDEFPDEDLLVEEPASRPADCFDTVVSDMPSDCRWRREDGFNALTFSQSGHLSLTNLGVLLFINLFWNGIVSVFVCSLFTDGGNVPQGAEWWGKFIFMIPFEVIGLAMVVALVLVALEPVRRTRWQIGRSSLLYRLTWFGLGPSWNWPIESLDHIDVENKNVKGWNRTQEVTVPWKSPDAGFRLSLVDRSNHEVCSIDNLTEGEAHWMAGVIRQERPMWFR